MKELDYFGIAIHFVKEYVLGDIGGERLFDMGIVI